MVLTGNSMGIAVKFGINTTLVALKMEISWQHSWYLSQLSLLPMLLLVQTTSRNEIQAKTAKLYKRLRPS